jgi:2-hydroxychromene-2-carboxylate isomerase
MSRRIDFYFDFPSPYAYLAHTQLPRIAAEHGATIDYHPFRILELMKIVGNRPTTIECKNKGKYAGTDLQRWVTRYKVDFAGIRTRGPSTSLNSAAGRWLPSRMAAARSM